MRTQIKIGGKVALHLISELHKKLEEEGLFFINNDKLTDYEYDGHIVFEADTMEGSFVDLENWLQKEKIDYDLWNDASNEWLEGCRMCRGGIYQDWVIDGSGDLSVDREYILDAFKNSKNEKEFMDLVREIVRPEFDILEPFSTVSAFSSNELKIRNTNPLATHCSACGNKLNDPMPGLHSMKHCPKCEP